MKTKTLIVMLLSIMAIGTTQAQTSTSTGNLTTNALLQSTCILRTTDLSFGTLNIAASAVSYGSIAATCSNGVSYKMFPTSGYGASTSANSYQILRSTTNQDCLLVQLAPNPGSVWSSYVARNISGVGTGSEIIHNIKANFASTGLPKNSDSTCTNNTNAEAAPGNYAGTVVVQVNY